MRLERTLFVVCVLSAACVPSVEVPADAQLRCARDGDCPRDTRCIDGDGDGVGLCLGESPCLTQGSLDVVADGTSCGDEGNVCVDGACTAPYCGDGVVDFAGGELCDPRRDGRCREDCTQALCGDGIVDEAVGETCDAQQATCVDCAVMCLGVVDGSPQQLIDATSDCNLEPNDGCECAARRFGMDRPEDRVVQQGALLGDTLYLVTADVALLQLGQRSLRLERATLGVGAGEPLARETLVDGAGFLDLAHVPGEEDVFYTVAGFGAIEVHRLRGDVDVIVRATTSDDDAVGRIALDDEHVYGAGPEGVRVFARDGDGTVSDDVLPSDTCRNGATGKLVSCGGVVACFGEVDGNIVTIDKVSGKETVVDHVDVVPTQLGAAANAQTLFCKDDRLHWHDRAAVFALDDEGQRRLVAQLPSLVRTVGAVENAAAFGDDILIAGVIQGTFQSAVVRVDLQRRVSTVVMPGAFLAHDGARIVGSAFVQGALVVLDVAGAP